MDLVYHQGCVERGDSINTMRNPSPAMDDDSFDIRQIDGLDELLDALERHCQTSAIVRVSGPTGEDCTFDIQRKKDGEIAYGYEPGHELRIRASVLRLISAGETAGITVRSFRNETNPASNLPYKELRGYTAWVTNNHIDFEQQSAAAVYEAFTTDAATGNPIDPEPEALYCGPHSTISGEDRLG